MFAYRKMALRQKRGVRMGSKMPDFAKIRARAAKPRTIYDHYARHAIPLGRECRSSQRHADEHDDGDTQREQREIRWPHSA